MISIKLHIDRPDADEYLRGLALYHWNALNKPLKGGGYKKSSVIMKMRTYLSEMETPEYLDVFAGGDVACRQRQRNLFYFFLDFDNFHLREAVVSEPIELVELRAQIMSIITEDDIYVNENGIVKQTRFGELLSDKIFSYNSFRRSSECINLLRNIGFDSATCPYCNHNVLDIVHNASRHKVSGSTAYLDIDHFFSKVQNPFFAVSFFNLLPSCHSCNSIDKGDKLFALDTHIHPYQESFDDLYRFRISLKALLGDPIDHIYIDKVGARANDNTVVDFNLQDRYSKRIDEAGKLVELFLKYKWTFGKAEENIFIDCIMQGIPREKRKILKFSSAKLKRDVLLQLDVDSHLKLI